MRQHSSVPHIQVPCLEFLSWLLSMTGCDGHVEAKQTLPLIGLVICVDHGQLKFMAGAPLGGTWSAIDCAFPCVPRWNARWVCISCAHSGVRICLLTRSPKALPPHVGLGLLWICCSCSVTVTNICVWGAGGMKVREERVQFGSQREGGGEIKAALARSSWSCCAHRQEAEMLVKYTSLPFCFCSFQSHILQYHAV